jgi:thioredoxin reductase (NADPH)
MDHDVIVIGGGPAGLAASLWLARYRLRVCDIDSNDPRNAPARKLHGYLGVSRPSPAEFRASGREQAHEAGAEFVEGLVMDVAGGLDDFSLTLADGSRRLARRILFSTGLRDIVPEITGLRECYGKSIWHCPDCDGPGTAGLRVGVIGWGRRIAAFCMEMLTWTDQLTILTDGKDAEMPERARAALARFDIPVRTAPIARIEHTDGYVESVEFLDGSVLPFDAMFFHIAWGPACGIPARLGCRATESGILDVDEDFQTSVPGVYAAGDITRGGKLAICAAADGTRAAIGIYRGLLPEDRRV